MPPPDNTISIVHRIRILHKNLYVIGRKIPKRDKLGLHADIENLCIEILYLSIEAAFKPRSLKRIVLENLRVKIGVLKNLMRTEWELEIIDEKTYIRIAEEIVEISKMATGWLLYITQKGA